MDYLIASSQEAVSEINHKHSCFNRIEADFEYEPNELDLIDIQQIIRSADRIAKRLEKACVAARLNNAEKEFERAKQAWEAENA